MDHVEEARKLILSLRGLDAPTAVHAVSTALYQAYYAGFEEGKNWKTPIESLEIEIKDLLSKLRPSLEEWTRLKGLKTTR